MIHKSKSHKFVNGNIVDKLMRLFDGYFCFLNITNDDTSKLKLKLWMMILSIIIR